MSAILMTVLNENDRKELRRLEGRAEQLGKEGPLNVLLERRADLDLAGRVRDVCVQRGHGGFSDVFIGYLQLGNGTECKVAVKKLRAHIMEDGKFQKNLAKELYIWSKLNHPRIIPLEGFYIENGLYPHLVSKWMENGTILKYLEAHPTVDMLSLVTGIAEGVHYLHLNEIVHSDIKPDNVLISDSGEALLCDFGVARMLAASATFMISTVGTGGMSGTVRYMSREILPPDSAPHSKESDVWALGMTIYTLMTRQVPYHDKRSDIEVIFAIINGTLPTWPECTDTWPFQWNVLRRICKFCWKEKRTRPSIGSFLSELRQCRLESGQNPSEIDNSGYRCHYVGKDGGWFMSRSGHGVVETQDESNDAASETIAKVTPWEPEMHEWELKNTKDDSFVTVSFRNRGYEEIQLLAFDTDNRLMHPEIIIRDGQIMRSQFEINVPVNFSATSGGVTKNFYKVFVNDTTIDVDMFFV